MTLISTNCMECGLVLPPDFPDEQSCPRCGAPGVEDSEMIPDSHYPPCVEEQVALSDPSDWELVVPNDFPGDWITGRDSAGQPLRMEMWYWVLDVSVPHTHDPEWHPYYVVVSGPVSPLAFARD